MALADLTHVFKEAGCPGRMYLSAFLAILATAAFRAPNKPIARGEGGVRAKHTIDQLECGTGIGAGELVSGTVPTNETINARQSLGAA